MLWGSCGPNKQITRFCIPWSGLMFKNVVHHIYTLGFVMWIISLCCSSYTLTRHVSGSQRVTTRESRGRGLWPDVDCRFRRKNHGGVFRESYSVTVISGRREYLLSILLILSQLRIKRFGLILSRLRGRWICRLRFIRVVSIFRSYANTDSTYARHSVQPFYFLVAIWALPSMNVHGPL